MISSSSLAQTFEITSGDNVAACGNDTIPLEATATGFNSHEWFVNGASEPFATGASVMFPMLLLNGNSDFVYCYAKADSDDSEVSDFIFAFPKELPEFDLGNDTTICNESTLTLAPELPTGYDITWSTGETTPSIEAPVPGTYTLTLSSPTKCSNSDQITLSSGVGPTVIVGGEKAICENNPTQLSASASGSGPYSYSWSPTTGLDDPTSANPVANPDQTTTYTVSITSSDPNECGVKATQKVFVSKGLQANVAQDYYSACKNKGSSFSGSASGGIPTAGLGYSYSWSPAQGLSSTSSPTPTATVSEETTYTLTVTDSVGCTAQTTVLVEVPNLSVSLSPSGNQGLCLGNTLELQANVEADLSYTFGWTSDAPIIDTTTLSPSSTPDTAGVYNIGFWATASNGCREEAFVTMTASDIPTVSITSTKDTLCVDEQVQWSGNATGLAPFTFEWTSNKTTEVLSTSSNFTLLNSTDYTGRTTYSLQAKDANGCASNIASQNSLLIGLPNLTIKDAQKENLECIGDTFLLDVSNQQIKNFQFQWTDLGSGAIISDSSKIQTMSDGQFEITVVNPIANCTSKDTISVSFIRAPQNVMITGPTESSNGENFFIEATSSSTGVTFLWKTEGLGKFLPASSQDTGTLYIPSLKDFETIRIHAYAKNKCGIDSSAFLDVYFTLSQNIVFVPNTLQLSSSNPEVSSIKVYSDNLVEENFLFTIVDRKGRTIFQTSDLTTMREIGWDGSSTSEIHQQNAVSSFKYFVKGVYKDGSPVEKSGNINVIP